MTRFNRTAWLASPLPVPRWVLDQDAPELRYPWSSTSLVVPPDDYRRALDRLADWWAGRFPFAVSPDVVAFVSV